MTLSFQPVSISHQNDYNARLAVCPEAASDYSFINLWSWADVYGLELAWTEGLAWIRQTRPEQILWAPVGDWHSLDWQALKSGWPGLFRDFTRVPETLVSVWRSFFGEGVSAYEDRDLWDYIYDAEELSELSGNRFHKKKNLVNQFKKKNSYVYAPMTGERSDMAMALQDDWCSWRICESSDQLEAENQAIMRALADWDKLEGVTGAVVFVDDLIVAFTIGERLNRDTLVVHFEKACPNYKGSYQAINQMFVQSRPERVRWVNREQDAGDEGLRKAKLSYNPVRFLKKYRLQFSRQTGA